MTGHSLILDVGHLFHIPQSGKGWIGTEHFPHLVCSKPLAKDGRFSFIVDSWPSGFLEASGPSLILVHCS